MDDAQQSDDLALNAESEPNNRRRVKSGLSLALRRAGAILPDHVVEALVEVSLKEMADVRRRISYMVYCFADHFEGAYTREKLERLELVLLRHHRDENNLGFIPQDMLDDDDNSSS